MGRSQSLLAACGLFVGLSVVMTYPLVLNADRAVTDPGDPLLNTWIIAWDVHQITHAKLASLFDANIFYPHHRTLVYSEHLLPQALVALPVLVVTGNPILAYNFVLLFGFATSGLGMFVLVRHLTRSAFAAVVSGMIFAFSPFMFGHLPHMQVIFAGGIPLALYFLHRFFDGESWRDIGLFAVCFAVAVLANGYYALFLSFFVVFFVGYHAVTQRKLTHWRFWGKLLAAAALVAAATGPFFYQYILFQTEMGFARGLGSHVQLTCYLGTNGENRLWGPITQAFRRGECQLFPGVVALLLATIGLFSCRPRRQPDAGAESFLDQRLFAVSARHLFNLVAGLLALVGLASLAFDETSYSLKIDESALNPLLAALAVVVLVRLVVAALARPRAQRRRWREEGARVYVAIGAMAFLFCFGDAGPYLLLYRYVPGFDGLRAISRWHMFVMLALAVLAGFGVRALAERMRGRPRFLLGAVPLLLAVEYASFPLGLDEVPVGANVPAVYRWLAASTAPQDAVIELPLPPADQKTCSYECQRVYLSSYHFRPLVNGYSGYMPPLYQELCRRWDELPLESNLADLRLLGVHYVVVHQEGWKPKALEKLNRQITGLADQLRLVTAFPDASVYELAGSVGQSVPTASLSELKPLPRGEWRVQATVRDSLAARAIDGDMSTRWESGPQRKGTYFTLDLGRPERVQGISLELGTSRRDYPRGFRVELSMDGASWKVVAEDARTLLPITAFLKPTDLSFDVAFPADDARFIRLSNLQDDPVFYWSIHEIAVY